MVKQFEKRIWDGKYLVPESRQKSKGGYRESRATFGYQDANRHANTLKPLMVEKYDNISLFVIDEPSNEKHGGYKYLITSGATSHTAFHTENGFKRYLARTGLKSKFISRNSNGTSHRLIGSYERITMAGNYKLLNEFGKKNGLTRTKLLDNGDYTTGYYGNGKIYLLNTNYPRTIYNHFRE